MSLCYHHDYFGGAAGKRFATLKKSYEAKSGVRLPDFPPDWGSGKPSRLAKKPRMAARKDGHLLKPGMAARKDEHLSKRRNGSPERRDDSRERPTHWGVWLQRHGRVQLISNTTPLPPIGRASLKFGRRRGSIPLLPTKMLKHDGRV